MYDNDSYSNGSGLFGGKLKEKLGIGSGSIKEKLGIGDGKILGIVVNPVKNAEYEANKNIISGNINKAYVASNTKPLDVVEEAKVKADDKQKTDEIIAQSNAIKEVAEVPKIAPSSTTPEAKKSNTIMYIGIGVGVLVIGIVAIILIKRKK